MAANNDGVLTDSDKSARKAPAMRPCDAPLFEALRALRRELAEEQGVPPYVVFGDATLVEMARRRPASRCNRS